MVYQNNEYSTYKFASVYSSVQNFKCGVFIIVDSDKNKTDFYMGIKALDKNRTGDSYSDTLKNAFNGQFPGIKTKDLLEPETNKLLAKAKGDNIAAVSCIAQNKDKDFNNNEEFLQGLEKFVVAMEGKEYTAILLAKSIESEQLISIREAYENIYTSLSPFSNMQLSYTTSTAINISNTLSTGTSKSDSISKGNSSQSGHSESSSTSFSNSSTAPDKNANMIRNVGKGIVNIASIVAAPLTGGTSLAVAGGLLLTDAAIDSVQASSQSHSESNSSSTTTTTSFSTNENESISHTDTNSSSNTEGTTVGSNDTMQLTTQNKSIINTLKKIDAQLERIEDCESTDMWEYAAYFISDTQKTSEMVAGTYKALMKGTNSGVETSAINHWGLKNPETKKIHEYITNFIHPVFEYKTSNNSFHITGTTLSSSNEIAIQMGLPRKSVCGFPVIEHSEFSKEILKYNNNPDYSMENFSIGKIFNMGSVTSANTSLDANSLVSHTFVTGSTGSGKSNTIYKMLDELTKKDVKFLVVEPTKGEYKNVFGNRRDVEVYGTNYKLTKLLKINPFRFHKDIHVLEHLDRLIDIFNVCWPMYAAMPAILKDAMERAYKEAGWDLQLSENKYSDNLFPNFLDVLDQISNVLYESEYSADNKGDYIGALSTRIRSLTNGINGMIFTNDDILDNDLFNENVIVDLSRVGSSETKSLIMGLLVMKLSEYHMVCGNQNAPLKHVTVLEEAHNILKRTSTEQSSEGSNLLGKSVEMLSNAIAEMRTYGEGFIIADQSSSMLDMSAIRNTNTKIIMKLPDVSDRELVGKAANLNDDQITELSRLETGVAAIYQNNWLEPVLCKVDEVDHTKNEFYIYNKDFADKLIYRENLKSQLIEISIKNQTENISKELREQVLNSHLKVSIKVSLFEYLADNKNLTYFNKFIYELFDAQKAVKKMDSQKDIDSWIRTIIFNTEPIIDHLTEDEKYRIVGQIFKEHARIDSNYQEVLIEFVDKIRKSR